MRALLTLGALALAGCASQQVRADAAEDLEGLRLPLASGPVRAAAVGTVRGQPAEFELELASPISRISAGCFPGDIHSAGNADVPKWSGGYERLPEIAVSDARLGDRTLHTRPMVLSTRTDACVVQLGSDVLGPYALEIDPEKRELHLSRSSVEPGPAWQKAVEIELARDPRTDWPILPARVFRGDKAMIAPFVISTSRSVSRLSPKAYGAEGEGSPEANVDVDALELAPKVAVTRLAVEVEPKWKQTVASGVLGGDVWGWFRLRIDPRVNRLFVAPLASHKVDPTAFGKSGPALPEEPEPDDPVSGATSAP